MQARSSVLIERPPAEVFGFLADPSNDRLWRSHLVVSRGTVAAVGDRVTQTYSQGGRSTTVAITVAEYDPPNRLAFALTDPAHARLAFGLRSEERGTRVTAALSATLTGPLALFDSRAQSEAEKALKTDLGRLKVALEGR